MTTFGRFTYKLCMALPEVIHTVVTEEGAVLVPEDTVIQELKKVAKLYSTESNDLAMTMAVYMLGFSSYHGFFRQEEFPFPNSSESLLKRIYEYAKQL